MGKYSKVIKKVEFETRLAVNGWLDTTCKTCGWTENHDVHVRLGYRFCPGCGGSVTKDRFKYDIRYADKHTVQRCGNAYCKNSLCNSVGRHIVFRIYGKHGAL